MQDARRIPTGARARTTARPTRPCKAAPPTCKAAAKKTISLKKNLVWGVYWFSGNGLDEKRVAPWRGEPEPAARHAKQTFPTVRPGALFAQPQALPKGTAVAPGAAGPQDPESSGRRSSRIGRSRVRGRPRTLALAATPCQIILRSGTFASRVAAAALATRHALRADSVSLRSAGREAGKGSGRRRSGTGTWIACRAAAWWARTGGATR